MLTNGEGRAAVFSLSTVPANKISHLLGIKFMRMIGAYSAPFFPSEDAQLSL